VDMLFVNEPDTISSLENNPAVTVVDVPLNALVYVGFNCQKTPLDEKEVRQAMSQAINKQQILDTALGGVGELAYSPLSPTLPGFSTDLQSYEIGFDLEKARQQLEQAGFEQNAQGIWERGQPGDANYSILENWILLTSTRAPNPEIAVVLQSNLNALGIPLEIQVLDAKAAAQAAADGQYDLMLWRYDWSDSDILYTYLSTERIGSTNRNNYSNPTLDGILQSALGESDDASRDQLYFDAQKLLMDELPWLPLYVPRDVIAVRATIQDVVAGQMGRILLNDARVTAE
jgi:peptide/nickel transport system substrate-binding protein